MIPTTVNVISTMMASISGMAMRDVAGKFTNGMILKMLLKNTNKKMVVRKGAKALPCGPMMSTAMPSRTNPMIPSPTACSLPGTTLGLAKAASISPAAIRIDTRMMMWTRLISRPATVNRVGRLKISPAGGTWNGPPYWLSAARAMFTRAAFRYHCC